LIDSLQIELPDVDLSKYNDGQLRELFKAVFGEHELPKPKPKKKKKVRKPKVVDLTRSRVRLVFPEHSDYLVGVQKHLRTYDVNIYIMQTGLAVKVQNDDGYEMNLLNYLELRLIDGELFGNLYLNRIKSESQIEPLRNIDDHRFVKNTFMVEKVSEKSFKKIIDKQNMGYLVNLCRSTLRIKKNRNEKLLKNRKNN
jgi:hypothetical protein